MLPFLGFWYNVIANPNILIDMREFKTHPHTITDHTNESVQRYLREVSRIERISMDEEADLARLIQRGGHEAIEARDKLVKANLRFVVSVANQYKSSHLDLADLISEGNLGLIKAAERFDDTKGFKFITYAVWWIRQSIMAAVANQSSTLRLPSNQQKILNQYRQFQQDILQREERTITIGEFCEVSGYDYERVACALGSTAKPMFVDERLGNDSDTTFGDMLASESVNDAALEQESLQQEIDNVFRHLLTDREAYVLKKLYGLGCEPLPLDEIALHLNISRERTRQISLSSIKKLRVSPYSSHLMDYLAA